MFRSALLAAVAASCLVAPASAANITWTEWSGAYTPSASNTGTAAGTAGTVGVTYTGNLFNTSSGTGNPHYTPVPSYSGGTVGNAPPDSFAINLTGGPQPTGAPGGPNTISFSTAVVNPIFAFWSLGQGGVGARFIFNTAVTFEAGGPGSDYGGQAITTSGNTVTGNEGNGVAQLTGTFSSVSFTTPVFEDYYAFTVGYTSLAVAVPEPVSLALLGTGLLGLAAVRRRKV